MSYRTGVTLAVGGVYSLSGDGLGTLSLLADLPAGGVDLAFDVTGYFLADSTGQSHSPAPPVCKHDNSVQAVDCWEGGLRLSGSANNLRAYREAKIRVDFKQSGSTLQQSTYAYWDGGMAFTFRTSFPFKGTWTWTAVCEECLGRTVNPTGGTIFARNLAARMAGFFVVYSVGWDNRVESATYSCGSDSNPSSVVNGFTPDTALVTKMKSIGMELDAAAPKQLITTHLGGGTPFLGADSYFHDPGASGLNAPLASSYSYFHREPWLDFHLFQSGQCNPDRASVFENQGTRAANGSCQNFVQEPQLACVMRRARVLEADPRGQ